ncbi:MAG TPA: transposase [Gemmatimonadaceae bacterium]|jgi:transposase-like protein|nr:transposase [Gemmatimonadaceae bacterium]
MNSRAKSPHASRTFSKEFKRSVVAQLSNKTPAALATEHKIHVSRIYDWRKKYGNGSAQPPAGGTAKPAPVVAGRRNAVSGLSLEQKRAAVAELDAGGNAKEIAAKNHVSDASVYAWRKKFQSGGAVVPVNGTPPQKVTVFRAAAKNGAKALSVADGSIAVRDATIFLNRAVAELDDMRPRDLGAFHLSVLWARNSLIGK